MMRFFKQNLVQSNTQFNSMIMRYLSTNLVHEMPYREIGMNTGNPLKVSAVGLGCMSMSEFYGEPNEEESIATLNEALNLNINFFDTADIYGIGHNETLVGKVLCNSKIRRNVVIATKCGILRKKEDPTFFGVDTSPKHIEEACKASLKRLGTDYIDLYYLHRLDGQTPIEESMLKLKELVEKGYIRHIGLSEVQAETIRRAHRIHPITAIQSEYSLWVRDVEENDVLATCKELGIGFIPYSPLGRGFLTGNITKNTRFEETDFRNFLPRFQEEVFEANLQLVEALSKIAKEKQYTPAQLSLAWLLAQNDHIVPIPGTKRQKYLRENSSAVFINLNHDELSLLDNLSKEYHAIGERYLPEAMKLINH